MKYIMFFFGVAYDSVLTVNIGSLTIQIRSDASQVLVVSL